MRSRVIMLVLLALVAFAAAGCSPAEEPEPLPEPKVAPPVIGEAGVLRVGVDLAQPPFAGVDKGRMAGIDVDIASAIASELGLELELVEVASGEEVAALDGGRVDAVMSLRLTDEAVMSTSFAGFYAVSGPAIFVSGETTVTPAQLGTVRIAAQEGSEAYWRLVYDIGEDRITVAPTLREAFDLLEAGDVDVVAGDAFVGAYIARDFDDVRFSSQLPPSTQIGIGVSTDATELSSVLRDTLDTLATAGVLDTIRAKWVGDLPELSAESDDDA